jgi:hypothetical protein
MVRPARPLSLMVLASCALFAVATLAGGVGATRSPQGQGVVIRDSSGTWPRGLWFVSLSGKVRRLVGRTWWPAARAGTGAVAAVATQKRDRSLYILSGRKPVRVRDSSGAVCASWSSSGKFLAFVRGHATVYARVTPDGPAYAADGILFVQRAGVASGPTEVARGLFPSAECPAWSPLGDSLAYVVGEHSPDPMWKLRVFANQATKTVGSFAETVPSTRYRTFDWSSARKELIFSTGDNLYRYAGGAPKSIGTPGVLTPIRILSSERGYSSYPRSVRFGPDGQLFSVRIGNATGTFTREGTLLRVLPGALNGWSGRRSVLTLYPKPLPDGNYGPITLWLYDAQGSRPGQSLERSFKDSVVTDPAGGWFAYRQRSNVLIVRGPTGHVLRRVSLSFGPNLLQAVQGTRVLEWTSAY